MSADEDKPEKAKAQRLTMRTLKDDLDRLKQGISEDVIDEISNLDARTSMIESRIGETLESVNKVITKQAELHEEIDILMQQAKAATESQRGVNCEKSTTEIGFAQPEAAQIPDTSRQEHVSNIAICCQTLADVLLVCRYLKAVAGLSNEKRAEILRLACSAAGEKMTSGLQIRAGVSYVAT